MKALEFHRRLRKARSKVSAEIEANAKRSFLAAGMANEGYAGGYLQALDDIRAILQDHHPADPRRYWREDA